MNKHIKYSFDQHLHSIFSCDAANDCTIERIAETAIEKDLSGIAITDHFDPFWPDEGSPSFLDIPAYEAALAEAEKQYAGRIGFAKGLELGMLPGEALSICQQVVDDYPYDFIIASVHYNDFTPIDYPPFLEGRSLNGIIEEYYSLVLDSIRAYKNYDVLGHLNHIDRYTGDMASEEIYMPFVDEILKVAISDGKGIEINTSSRRYGISERGTPSVPIIKRFKELGGEIITIGSDAHEIAHIGTYIKEGEDILLACGIKYIAFFNGRRPEFFRI